MCVCVCACVCVCVCVCGVCVWCVCVIECEWWKQETRVLCLLLWKHSIWVYVIDMKLRYEALGQVRNPYGTHLFIDGGCRLVVRRALREAS